MLYSPALSRPSEGHNAQFPAIRIANVGISVHLSGANQDLIELECQLHAAQSRSVTYRQVDKETLPAACGASLVYAGYPYDPYA